MSRGAASIQSLRSWTTAVGTTSNTSTSIASTSRVRLPVPVIGSTSCESTTTTTTTNRKASTSPRQIRCFSSACSNRNLSTSSSHSSSSSTNLYPTPRPSIPIEVRKPNPTTPSTPNVEADHSPLEDNQVQAEVENVEESDNVPIETHEQYIAPPLDQQALSLLFSFTNPPPPSALSAFAHRIEHSVLDSSSSSSASTTPSSLISNLPLVEQCLIHESFWNGVDSLPSSKSSRTFTNYHDTPLSSSPSTSTTTALRAHNGPLATLGNALLGTWASELITHNYPKLPTQVNKSVLTMFVGPRSLSSVVEHAWGVAPTRLDQYLVGRVEPLKMSRKEKAYGHLVGGVGGARKTKDVGFKGGEGAAGIGLMRWNRSPVTTFRDKVLYEDALASVARAVVGAIYQTKGFAAARDFAYAHFLSSLVTPSNSINPSSVASSQILPLLKFSNPGLTLASHLQKNQQPRPSYRLLKESGRLTNHATFISGVYSGDKKLGEGFGSSLKMSQFRASTDALRRIYLSGKSVQIEANRQVGKKDLGSDYWI